MQKCIIFDMDGTLIDSAHALCAAINGVRAELGMHDLSRDAIMQIVNHPDANAITRLYGGAINDAMRKSFQDKMSEHYASAPLFDESSKVIDWARQNDILLAVASNASQQSVDENIARLNLNDSFVALVGTSDDLPQKPEPKMLLAIINSLKCDAIFIGDSIKDHLAAKNANIPYINVLWGHGIALDGCANLNNADKIIEHIKILKGW